VPPANAGTNAKQPLDLRDAAVEIGSGVNEVVDARKNF
jgi:hypothetical protein